MVFVVVVSVLVVELWSRGGGRALLFHCGCVHFGTEVVLGGGFAGCCVGVHSSVFLVVLDGFSITILSGKCICVMIDNVW